MSRPIIEVENLSKRYRLGQFNARTMREEVEQFFARFRNGEAGKGGNVAGENSEFWALKNVSFAVQPGEVVGIIGRNGAGKSTLLKILSRVTEPTNGGAYIRGRVASLLEVGTGFHPELTGRENIFLNGAILGMTKAEIKAKFDEIVDFSGVAKFIDTPVKRYSSGMYVRLAFAVAAHLDPEILIVDEVLAVGDAGFQKKCLRKMQDVSSENGRTVLLVSHSTAIIQKLCGRVMLLDAGKLIYIGSADQVVSEYISSIESLTTGRVVVDENHPRRLPGMVPIIKEVWITDQNGKERSDFEMSGPLTVCIAYDNSANSISLTGSGFFLEGISGVRVGGFNTYMGATSHRIPSKGVVRFTIDEPTLTPGRYFLTVSVGTHQSYLADKIEHALSFDILPKDIYETGYILTPEDGVVALKCRVDVG